MPSNKPRPVNSPTEGGDNGKIVDFLLDISDAGPEADIYAIARKNEINNPDKVLEDFAGIVGANRLHYPQTFPQDVLKYYNAGLSPQGDLLQVDDITSLDWLARRYAEKLMNKAAPQQSYSTMSGNNQPPYQYQQPPYQYQQQPPTYQQPPPYQYPPMPSSPQDISLPPPSEDSAGEAHLLEYILNSVYNPRPHLIPRFLDMFRRFHQYWVQNPNELYELMKQNFSEQTGNFAFGRWARMRNIVVPNLQTGQTMGVNVMNPMGMAMPGQQASMMGMPAAYQTKSEEDLWWEKQEKMMERRMRMDYMKMMSTMGQTQQAQQAPPPGTAYVIKDVVDSHGRPTGAKEYIPTPIGQAGQQQESRLTEILLQSAAQRENILLQKLEQPNNWLEKLATTALSNHAQTVNPFEGFKQILALNNELNQNKPQEQTKSLEALSKEIDAKLALAQLNMQERKEQREFEREITQEKTASENAKEYIDAIKEVVGKGIQPLVSQFASGLAGQQQQQVQAQQAQVTQQQQEAMMMQQQQLEAQRIREQALHEAQIRQQQKVMQQQMMQQQHQHQNQVPIDEQLSNLSDGQLEQAFAELDQGLRQNERVYKKISAERAKRRMMRGGGIGARVQQQQVFAQPPTPPQEQSFEERIKAGQQAQEEEEEEQEQETQVTSEPVEDTTKSTMGAVTTEMKPDDQIAMQAGKDGIAAQPMDFKIGGVPEKEEAQTDDSEPPLEEEEEEYEEGEEES